MRDWPSIWLLPQGHLEHPHLVQQHNLEEARPLFPAFKVGTWNPYLGGFIGEDEALNEWLGETPRFGRKLRLI
jgi:hypothetical protein